MAAGAAVGLGGRLAAMIGRGGALRELGKAVLPASKGEWAMRLGPEAAFAGLNLAMTGDPLLALEELALGLGGGTAGAMAGGALPFRAARRRGLSGEALRQEVSGAANIGDMVGGIGGIFLPPEMRPFGSQFVARQEQQAAEQMNQMVQQETERRLQEMGGAPMAPANTIVPGPLLQPSHTEDDLYRMAQAVLA